MPRKGRELEVLVALIEKTCAFLDAEVKSPDFLIDKDTGERREVDVSIRSKVGSANVLIIVECRDRDDVEDSTWIEQLSKKKEAVSADKVIAVTSKSFTKPAIKKALSNGIDVRMISDITKKDIMGWFSAEAADKTEFKIEVSKINLFLKPSPYEYSDFLKQNYGDMTKKIYHSSQTGEKYALDFFINVEISKGIIFNDVPKDGSKIRKTIKFNNNNPDENISVDGNGGLISVSHILVESDLSIVTTTIQPSKMISYSNENKSISQVVQFNFGKQIVSLHKNMESGQAYISIEKNEDPK